MDHSRPSLYLHSNLRLHGWISKAAHPIAPFAPAWSPTGNREWGWLCMRLLGTGRLASTITAGQHSLACPVDRPSRTCHGSADCHFVSAHASHIVHGGETIVGGNGPCHGQWFQPLMNHILNHNNPLWQRCFCHFDHDQIEDEESIQPRGANSMVTVSPLVPGL